MMTRKEPTQHLWLASCRCYDGVVCFIRDGKIWDGRARAPRNTRWCKTAGWVTCVMSTVDCHVVQRQLLVWSYDEKYEPCTDATLFSYAEAGRKYICSLSFALYSQNVPVLLVRVYAFCFLIDWHCITKLCKRPSVKLPKETLILGLPVQFFCHWSKIFRCVS